MPVVKRMVCLANSRKRSGRCVAGKELSGNQPGGWIRPVSAREHEEVSEYERQYQDGSDPRVLDIIDVPLLKPQPKGYQQENWLLDPDQYWTRTGRGNWGDLKQLADPVRPLWIDGHHTYNGFNDKLPLAFADKVDTSLRLVRVEILSLVVFESGGAFGNPKRRVQGQFKHGSTEYHLWVTDPEYERAYLAKPNGNYKLGECYLTVSLGESFNDACYKLIAAIIERDKGS